MLKSIKALFAQICLGLALLAASGAVLAAGNLIPGVAGSSNSAWTVYAFGNAQAVADTFRALNNFTSSSLFQSIVGMIAVLGVLVVGLSSGFSSAMAKKFIGYIVAVYLICYVFFGIGNDGPLVANVEVMDTVDMTWKAPVTVPAVVGIPAALISTAGYEITRQIEASFPIPEEMKMSNGAPFNLASSLLSDASQARISDPNLASSMSYYVQDCFIPAVARGDLVATTLTQSTNFLNDIRWDSQSVMVMTSLGGSSTGGGSTTTYEAGQSNLVTCAVAWSLINSNINDSSVGAASFLQNASAWAKTPALSVVNSAADSIAQWASNNGITDGGALVKQSAVLATFSGAFKQAAAATGNSDFLTGLNVAQAQSQQTNSWIMGAEVFNRSMGYIYAILQVFIYAATPLVLAAALVPGLGFALLKNFGQLLLWMAIWQPMLSIVNFIVISMQQADLGGALSSGAGEFGFTLTNMGIITQKTANMRAAALFIGTMVPALAWGLVKGSVDFSRFISEAAGDRFAQSAALSMTTGSYSLNQASMDSFTANKHSLGATGDWGGGLVNAGGIGALNDNQAMGGGMRAGMEQSPNVATSHQVGTNKGGSSSDTSNDTVGGSHALNGGKSSASARTGGVQETGADGQSASSQTNVQAGAGITLRPFANGDKGGAALAAGGPGTQQDGSFQPTKTNAEPGLIKKGMSALGNGVAVNTGLTMSGTNGESAQVSKTSNDGKSGTNSLTGGETYTATDGSGNTKTAGTTNGYSDGKSLTVTGVASLGDRVAALDAYRQSQLSNFGRDESAGLFSKPPTDTLGSSKVGEMSRDISKQDAVPNAIALEQKAIATEKRGYDNEADKLRAEAEANKSKADAAANADIDQGKKLLAQQKVRADESAGAGMAGEVKEGTVRAASSINAEVVQPMLGVAKTNLTKLGSLVD